MFPILDLSGAPFERGMMYGRQARTQVTGSIRCYAALFASCGIDWKEAQARAAAFHDIIDGCGGGMMDEIAGIAAGSGFHLNEILALNCRTEILPPTSPETLYPGSGIAVARNAALGLFDLGECTSLAVTGSRCADGHTRVAQNWDWIGYQRANVVGLRVRREGWPDFLTLTEAGILAKIGVNEHGLAVGLNILRSVNDREQLGIPVHIFQRMALDCQSVNAIVALAQSLRFAASSNAILGDASGHITSLEYSPDGAAALRPDHGVVLHTNHFCDPRLARNQMPLAQMLTTEPRLHCADHHVAQWPDLIDDVHLGLLLRDESGGVGGGALAGDQARYGAICRSPDPALAPELRIESVFGVIIDCDVRAMLVAPGIPSQVDFELFAL